VKVPKLLEREKTGDRADLSVRLSKAILMQKNGKHCHLTET
jgi:hypothetical protein